MTDSPEQAPAGWYSDPHAPERMRYFDGQGWTNHFHDPGRLPDIGSWLNTTFSVFGRYWRGAGFIAVASSLVSYVGTWFAIRWLVADLAVVDEELVNFSIDKLLVVVPALIVALIWQGVSWLALNRFMQRAHFQAQPTVADAFKRALQRMPKFIALIIGMAAVAFLVMGVFIALFAVVPVVGALVLLAGFVALVWLFVKLSFVLAAVVAAPRDAPVLRTSASVSTGRFWPVFGRILLITVALAVGGNILAAGLGEFGTPYDADAVAETFFIEGDSITVNDFLVSDLLPGTTTVLIVMVISSIIRAVSTLISTSAFMRLYLDGGGPSEI